MSVIASLSPTQSNAQAALRAFLLNVLPQPAGGGAPAVFQGSISGTTLTVTGLPALSNGGIQGTITLGSPLLGAAPGTIISAFLTGTGGVGTYQVSLSQTVSDVKTMSTGASVVAGQPNRVPEPNNPWFVVMTPMFSRRLGTNQDASTDCKLTGSISGNTLTVSAIASGVVQPGASVFAPGVATGTAIVQQLTGSPGSTGTYQVNISQTVASETMSAGAKTMTASEEWTLQLDFHAPDYLAGDFARTVSISYRDEFATGFFSALSAPLNNCTPLYADDPRQVPFINGENQYEWRWSLDAHMQVDETVSIPAEYADSISLTMPTRS